MIGKTKGKTNNNNNIYKDQTYLINKNKLRLFLSRTTNL